jgi:hypothetical protein
MCAHDAIGVRVRLREPAGRQRIKGTCGRNICCAFNTIKFRRKQC